MSEILLAKLGVLGCVIIGIGFFMIKKLSDVNSNIILNKKIPSGKSTAKITEKVFQKNAFAPWKIPVSVMLIFAVEILLVGHSDIRTGGPWLLFTCLFLFFGRSMFRDQTVIVTEEKIVSKSPEGIGATIQEIRFKDVKRVDFQGHPITTISIKDDNKTIYIFYMKNMEELANLIKERVPPEAIETGRKVQLVNWSIPALVFLFIILITYFPNTIYNILKILNIHKIFP